MSARLDKSCYVVQWVVLMYDVFAGITTLWPEQYRRYFVDIFRCIFFNENVRNTI